jgi:hypothetical protein
MIWERSKIIVRIFMPGGEKGMREWGNERGRK